MLVLQYAVPLQQWTLLEVDAQFWVMAKAPVIQVNFLRQLPRTQHSKTTSHLHD